MPDFGFDDWMDAQLRNVPVPPDLLARLAESAPPRSDAEDAKLDLLVRSVPLPTNLEGRLRRIAREPRPMPLWYRVGLAASVLLVIGLSAGGVVALLGGGEGNETIASSPASPATTAATAGVQRRGTALPTAKVARAATPSSARRRAATSPKAPVMPASTANDFAPAVALASDQDSAASSIDNVSAGTDTIKPTKRLIDGVAAMFGSFRQAIESQRQARVALGSAGDFELLPALDSLELPAAQGITPPRVRGYDSLFQLKYGEHPFVSPASHVDLQTSRVPLSLRTASFDLAARGARQGQLPAADEIRVEDFLAAQDYALPSSAPGRVDLHVAGARAPLADMGQHLVQLAVQTGSLPGKDHPPTRLITIVDTSSAMRGNARWEAVKRALLKLAANMRPADRLTLVGFAEQSRVLADDASADELRALVQGSELPEPAGTADLSSAIRSACDALRSVKSTQARRVVFITAGFEDLERAAIGPAIEALAEVSDARMPWQFVRLRSGDADEQLNALARQGHGELKHATSPADIHRVLFEQLSGRQVTVAYAASLKVTFDPKTVTGYRLVGHEAHTLTGPAAGPLEVDLPAGHLASGLFEVWVKPGSGDQVAVAELTWRNSAGQEQRRVQTIRRTQIGGSFSQAPVWLQQGVIAAKTAEILRGSFYAPKSRPAGQYLELAEQVDSQVARQANFVSLVELLKLADKSR